MTGCPSGRDGAILLARDCLFSVFCSLDESFLSQNIFRDRKKIFSVRMEIEKEKTESVNDNKNKESKNFDEFEEYILQQNPVKTKVKTQSDKKAWNAM